MKIKKNNLIASVLIVNFNNARYLTKCLNSIFNQDYKKIEIIVIDDQSSDNSLTILKKFSKKIKIIKTKKKFGNGNFNQMNAFLEGFNLSKGDIIFLLDSDDYFNLKKISKIILDFEKEKKLEVVFDLPIKKFTYKEKKIYNRNLSYNNYWPYIPPTSCISLRRNTLRKIFKLINFKLFPNIWFDFRIGIISKYIFKGPHINHEHLTYYRQSNENVSSNFKFLSKNWWKRRKEAHKYIRYFFSKNKIRYEKNSDYFITAIINFFI